MFAKVMAMITAFREGRYFDGIRLIIEILDAALALIDPKSPKGDAGTDAELESCIAECDKFCSEKAGDETKNPAAIIAIITGVIQIFKLIQELRKNRIKP